MVDRTEGVLDELRDLVLNAKAGLLGAAHYGLTRL